MKKLFSKLVLGNSLLKGSAIVVVSSLLGSFGAYLYHLLMGRFLGPVKYGVLESLISITYFLGIPINVLMIVVVKFISSNKDSREKVSLFIKRFLKGGIVWGLIILILFFLSYPIINNLLMINSFILFAGIGILSFLGIFSSLFTATMQGLAQFIKYSVITVFTSWSKLIIAVIFVLLGFGLFGSVYSIVLSGIFSVVLGYFLAKKFINFKLKGEMKFSESFKGVKNYSLSAFIFNLSMTSIYTTDILLAKYFLSPVNAGQYAALSVLGKIIFFASSPISTTMFPLVSERFSKKQNYLSFFRQSFILTLLISIFVSLFFFLFPKTMIAALFGKAYIESAKFLGNFSIFISIYALSFLMLNFFLSISKPNIVYIPLFFSVFQALLICILHSDIGQIVNVNIIIVSLLLLSLLVVYFQNDKKNAFGGRTGL